MTAHPAGVLAAARARRQATAVAAVGALVPTILAAQGMTALAVDVLGFAPLAAVALAGFLELALLSSALLARAAALTGRPGGADAVAVWVVSATSGVLAGVHELVVTTPDGSSRWSTDPGSLLAAAVRAVAPLVAAWLWDRVLQAARAEHAERTLVEVRRDRRLLDVARRALLVRRLDAAGRSRTRQARRARRRLDRAHLAALRVAPPTSTLLDVLAAVGQVDHLPAATSVSQPAAPLASPRGVSGSPAPALAERCAVAAAVPAGGAGTVTEHVAAYDGGRPPMADTSDTLALAVSIVRTDPAVSGAGLAAELARRGCPVSTRSGQRWRARAVAALTAEEKA
ncbi:hypothetical protein AB6N23_01885 [Cellulomonas sp. 179-A 9B4 NHS]|uniref:hypothetical protein n=1 Tax=Cellulomonas sp. 179-A 9B4 NHS TaxID=3142379 RepID=UPI00399F63C1